MPTHTGKNAEHYLTYKTADQVNGQDVYHLGLTGVAKFTGLQSDLEHSRNGQVTSIRGSFLINCRAALDQIPIPPRSGYRPRFHIHGSNIYLGLNEIHNANKAGNSRYGVSTFWLSSATTTTQTLTAQYIVRLRDYQKIVTSSFPILLYREESNAFIYQLGYQVEVLVYWDGGYVTY